MRSTDGAEAAGATEPSGPADPGPDGPASADVEQVTVPRTARRGGRAAQRRQRRRQKRIRTFGVVAAVAVVLGVLAAVVGSGGGKGNGQGTGTTGAPPVVTAPPVLVALKDGAGKATSLFVLAPAKGGGGTVVLIPPGTMTEVVSLGLEPVSQSLDIGGPSRLQATVENLLGVAMAGTAVVDDAGLAALLGPVGPISVDVPERVEDVDTIGRVNVLYEAGPVSVAPADAGRFLSAKGRSTDLSRLARHQKFVEAWIGAVHRRPDTSPTQPVALAKAFDALVAGSVRTRVLPVEAFGTAAVEGELYKVDDAELAKLVAEAFPSAAGTPAGPRPRVQILNGTGAIGLADAVRDKLGAAFDVRLTGNAATFDHAGTEVVYYDRKQQATAKRVRDALGLGTLVLSRNPLDVVDVTIIVGKDFGHA